MSQVITFLEKNQNFFELQNLSIVHTSWCGAKRYSTPNLKGSVSFEQLVSIAKKRFEDRPLITRLQIMQSLWVHYQAKDSPSSWKIVRLFQWILANTIIPFCTWLRSMHEGSNPVAVVAQLVQKEMSVRGTELPMGELRPEIQNFLIKKGCVEMWFDVSMFRNIQGASESMKKQLFQINTMIKVTEDLRMKIISLHRESPTRQSMERNIEIFELENVVAHCKEELKKQINLIKAKPRGKPVSAADYEELRSRLDAYKESLQELYVGQTSCLPQVSPSQ